MKLLLIAKIEVGVAHTVSHCCCFECYLWLYIIPWHCQSLNYLVASQINARLLIGVV